MLPKEAAKLIESKANTIVKISANLAEILANEPVKDLINLFLR